jgi:F0F1-type ATP synthase assembly protein I
MNNQRSSPTQNKSLLLKYAGLTMQIMVGLALAVFGGYKLDGWLKFKTPLFVWVLPLIVIIAMIWQVIRDTSKKK